MFQGKEDQVGHQNIAGPDRNCIKEEQQGIGHFPHTENRFPNTADEIENLFDKRDLRELLAQEDGQNGTHYEYSGQNRQQQGATTFFGSGRCGSSKCLVEYGHDLFVLKDENGTEQEGQTDYVKYPVRHHGSDRNRYRKFFSLRSNRRFGDFTESWHRLVDHIADHGRSEEIDRIGLIARRLDQHFPTHRPEPMAQNCDHQTNGDPPVIGLCKPLLDLFKLHILEGEVQQTDAKAETDDILQDGDECFIQWCAFVLLSRAKINKSATIFRTPVFPPDDSNCRTSDPTKDFNECCIFGSMQPSQLVLRAENLVKKYKDRYVVNEISLEVRQGEIVGLLGPNGAGKTTTFYMVVGLIRPNSGSVWLNDRNITRQPMYKRGQMGVGYLAQEASVFRKLSVEDNIMAVLEMRGGLSKKERKYKTDQLLAEFSLMHVRKNMGNLLSGGERRRTEIARALATDPKFILLDEPFAGVDPIAVEEIQGIVRSLQEKNIGVLITDHNVNETLEIVDRAYLLVEGQIFRSGTAIDLADDPLVRKVYLGDSFTLNRKR